MKKFCILFLFIISHVQSSQENSCYNASRDIFAGCTENNFVDDLYLNWNMLHTPGRLALLQRRVGEIEGVRLANEMLGLHSSDKAVVQSTTLYSSRPAQYVFHTEVNPLLQGQLDYLNIVASYIALTELALLDLTSKNNSLSHLISAFEQMRVHDLFLLKTIIEKDSLPAQTKNIQQVPAVAAQTHYVWQAASVNKLVHATSAYSVLKDALTMRNELNVDATNGDYYLWTFNAEQETKKEYERRLQIENQISSSIEDINNASSPLHSYTGHELL
jgi:hypothetical protein